MCSNKISPFIPSSLYGHVCCILSHHFESTRRSKTTPLPLAVVASSWWSLRSRPAGKVSNETATTSGGVWLLRSAETWDMFWNGQNVANYGSFHEDFMVTRCSFMGSSACRIRLEGFWKSFKFFKFHIEEDQPNEPGIIYRKKKSTHMVTFHRASYPNTWQNWRDILCTRCFSVAIHNVK